MTPSTMMRAMMNRRTPEWIYEETLTKNFVGSPQVNEDPFYVARRNYFVDLLNSQGGIDSIFYPFKRLRRMENTLLVGLENTDNMGEIFGPIEECLKKSIIDLDYRVYDNKGNVRFIVSESEAFLDALDLHFRDHLEKEIPEA